MAVTDADLQQCRDTIQKLLNKHYGIDLNDGGFDHDDYLASQLEAGVEPWQMVNELANDCDLDRIDADTWLTGRYISESDQQEVLRPKTQSPRL